MKKCTLLLLMAGLVCGLNSTPSQAAEVKVSGAIDLTFQRAKRSLDAEVGGSNRFDAFQRLDLNIDFIASEQLSARYGIRLKGYWGGDTKTKFGGDFSPNNQHTNPAANTSSTSLNTRNLYVDWLVPNTQVKVRMGKFPFTMPGFAFGSMIIDGQTPGVHVSSPINDNVAITAFWLRLNGNNTEQPTDVGNNSLNRYQNVDVLGMTLPMRFNGFDMVPFAAYANYGKASFGNHSNPVSNLYGNVDSAAMPNSGYGNAWWLGAASQLSLFDPFRLALDFTYGSSNPRSQGFANNVVAKQAKRAGWYVGLSASYETAYGIPGLKAWYTTGDSGNTRAASKRMPALVHAGSPIDMASTYFDSSYDLIGGHGVTNIAGTMGVGLQWKEISFMDKLSHEVSVTYIRGTNHKNNVLTTSFNNKVGASPIDGYWTTKDSAVDVNFTSFYSIYENLAASLELGYLFQNFDEKLRAVGNVKPDYQNIWRAALNFKYTF